MERSKVTFTSNGHQLAGILETPKQGALAFALYAHCFTCGKDNAAAARISRALVSLGFAVLRFDFCGLGDSEGDFSDTNFTTNINDLVAAADYLRCHHQAPNLLIGHSLGGAAVLKAAPKIPECVGVATIAAPSEANHVAKQFGCDLETIYSVGQADLLLAGRPFTIKRQFLEDIQGYSECRIDDFKGAVLVMHSAGDKTVSINEAENIYKAARHPKSFISLDKADHLLSQPKDAQYVATCVSAWGSRFLPETPSA